MVNRVVWCLLGLCGRCDSQDYERRQMLSAARYAAMGCNAMNAVARSDSHEKDLTRVGRYR